MIKLYLTKEILILKHRPKWIRKIAGTIKHTTLSTIKDDRDLVVILRNCLFKMFECFHCCILIDEDRRW